MSSLLNAEQKSVIESLALEVESSNAARTELDKRVGSTILPIVDKLLAEEELSEVEELIESFPACSARMIIGGKLMVAQRKLASKVGEGDFNLPDEICVATVPWDIDQQFNIVKSFGDPLKAEWLYSDDDDVIQSFSDEEQDEVILDNFPVWHYTINHYEAYKSVMIMPNIEKYGTEDEATVAGATKFINEQGLSVADGFEADSLVRNDDGVGTLVIYLRKK